MLFLDTPSWTDITQAFGAIIGFPVAAWGILKLFLKDKEMERKLSSLEILATAQTSVVTKMQEQIEELKKQTGHFQYQANLQSEHNKLVEKQLELQGSIFTHGKSVEERKLKLERLKRISEIKPYFTHHGGSIYPEGFGLKLYNNGGTAKDIKISHVKTEFVWFDEFYSTNLTVPTGQGFTISGGVNVAKTIHKPNSVSFEINLEFEDVDGNKYKQPISKSGDQYQVNESILID